MPRWMRVIRGMIGTGLTFAAGVGVLGSIIGLAALSLGAVSPREVMEIVGKTSVVSFIVGVAFSGVLAISARGLSFEKLSLRFVSALGAGAGLLYFLFIAGVNGAKVWSPADAVANLAILTLLGAGSASATLLVARRARHALKSGDEIRSLSEGSLEVPVARRESEEIARS
jgi:hypothetical protein